MDALDLVVDYRSYYYPLLSFLQVEFGTWNIHLWHLTETVFELGEDSMTLTQDDWLGGTGQLLWSAGWGEIYKLDLLEEGHNPHPVAKRNGGISNITSAGFSHGPTVGSLWSEHEAGTHHSRAGTTGRSRWLFVCNGTAMLLLLCLHLFFVKAF